MRRVGTGKGSVYRAKTNRGNAEIYFVKYLAPDEHGEMKWRATSSGSTDKADALKLLRQLQTDVDAGKPVAQTAGRKHAYTFEDATAAIVGDYRRKSGDATANILARNIARNLAPVFGGARMGEITTEKLAAYADARLKTGAANASVEKELRIVSRMFTLGIQSARLSWKPSIPAIGVDNAREGFFDRADFDAVVRRMPEQYRDLLVLAWWTGWRLASELAPLEWRHIDRSTREIRIPGSMTKNGEGRVFPYGALPEVCDAIDRLAARREAFRDRNVIVAALFVEDDGSPIAGRYKSMPTPMLRNYFRDAWRAACKAAGVADRIPHDLRRTAVRNLTNAGVPDKVAMMITGHKTRRIFERYNIQNFSDVSNALATLAAKTTPTPAPSAKPAPPAATLPRKRRSSAA